MKKPLPFIAALFVLVLLIAAAAWFYLWRVEKNLEQRIQKLEDKKALYLKARELETMWHTGNYKSPRRENLECEEQGGEKLEQISLRFSQCNPDLFRCWLKETSSLSPYQITQDNGEFFEFHYGALGRVIELKLESPETQQEQRLMLKDSCRDSFLPEGQYALGTPDENKADWFWDNRGRWIFIDKFPVSNRDIREWWNNASFEDDLKPKLEFKNDLSWLMKPATNLKAREQELYCASVGGQVLKAHIFDAAAFFPSDVKNVEVLPRGPYPEGPRRQDSYLGETQMLGETIDVEKICRSFYSQECKAIQELYAHLELASSWMGIFQVLGGNFEYLPNPVRPRRNLKLSSFHYPLNSSWHEIAERGFWSGEGFQFKEFNWRTEDPETKVENYGVSFRCYRSKFVGDASAS